MAALENIRKRSILLLSVIGFAMLAFILGDFMQSKRSGGSGSTHVGEILQKKINIQEFQKKVDEGIENFKIQNPGSNVDVQTTVQIRNQIWDQMVKDLILEFEYENIGISVTDEEFFELLQGSNVHPEISKVPAFQNPNTQKFDRARIINYLKSIDSDPTGEAKARWISFQEYLLKSIKESKYKDLISNSMYVAKHEAKLENINQNLNVTFNCLSIPSSFINDTIVDVNEKEIKDYYNNNIELFQQDESKDVDYVVFNVVYSNEDDEKTKSSISDVITDFNGLNSDEIDFFVRRNSDNPIKTFQFKTESELKLLNDPKLLELVKSSDSVIGPYKTSINNYRIAKLFDVDRRPDSVKAEHILIAPNEQISSDSAENIANQLLRRIENGEEFKSLASKFSDDRGSSENGGDLGWFKEGIMVKEFNDACFNANYKKYSLVKTQFGFHIIRVVNRSKNVKKYKIVYIDRNVLPSSQTFNTYYSKAAEFAGEILNTNIEFDSLVEKKNLAKRSDIKIKDDKENLSGLPNSREIVKWINKAKIGQISEVFQLENSFVVVYVKNHRKEGNIPLNQVRNSIISKLEETKKLNKIMHSFKSCKDLNDIAQKSKLTVLTNKIANFSMPNINGIGNKPKLVGDIISKSRNKKFTETHSFLSENSVLFYEITFSNEVEEKTEYSSEKRSLLNKEISTSANSSYRALMEKANITDNRPLFY